MADRLNSARVEIQKEVAQAEISKTRADSKWDQLAKRQLELTKAAEHWKEQITIAEGVINERRKVHAAERQADSEARAATRVAEAAEKAAWFNQVAAQAATRSAIAAERQARTLELQRMFPPSAPSQLEPTKVRIVP